MALVASDVRESQTNPGDIQQQLSWRTGLAICGFKAIVSRVWKDGRGEVQLLSRPRSYDGRIGTPFTSLIYSLIRLSRSYNSERGRRGGGGGGG